MVQGINKTIGKPWPNSNSLATWQLWNISNKISIVYTYSVHCIWSDGEAVSNTDLSCETVNFKVVGCWNIANYAVLNGMLKIEQWKQWNQSAPCYIEHEIWHAYRKWIAFFHLPVEHAVISSFPNNCYSYSVQHYHLTHCKLEVNSAKNGNAASWTRP